MSGCDYNLNQTPLCKQSWMQKLAFCHRSNLTLPGTPHPTPPTLSRLKIFILNLARTCNQPLVTSGLCCHPPLSLEHTRPTVFPLLLLNCIVISLENLVVLQSKTIIEVGEINCAELNLSLLSTSTQNGDCSFKPLKDKASNG